MNVFDTDPLPDAKRSHHIQKIEHGYRFAGTCLADKRQVEGARIGMTHVIGLGSACGIHILEKAA